MADAKISSTWYLDDNILQEILSRVPNKELVRFTTTCRRWKDLIDDPFFKANRTRICPPTIFGFFSISVNGGRLSYAPIDSNPTEAPDTSLRLPHRPIISIKAACNGLILFFEIINGYGDGHLFLSNPTTGAGKKLPYNAVFLRHNVQFGLAFDPAVSPTSFKAVAINRVQLSGEELYQFIILDGGGGWRTSHETLHCQKRDLFNSVSSVFHNGTLHWLGVRDIVAFNLDEERVYKIDLPPWLWPESIGGYPDVWFGLVRGCMSLVKFQDGKILVWARIEVGGGRWDWEMRRKISTQGTGGSCYNRTVPLFYDGDICVLLTWRSEDPKCIGLAVYRIGGRRWDKIRSLEGWMDHCRHFFLHTTNSCHTHTPW